MCSGCGYSEINCLYNTNGQLRNIELGNRQQSIQNSLGLQGLQQYGVAQSADRIEAFQRQYIEKFFNPSTQSSLLTSKQSTITKMILNSESYIIVCNNSFETVETTLAAAKSKATEIAHAKQASVYIFRPVFQIAPKRDVVETEITLAK